jgi:putative peptidoglycan lipid II flippase
VGILNSIGKYSVASLSPVILNILLIIALALPSDDILLTGYFLSFAVMLSGFLQFILIFLTLRKNRYSLELRRPKNYDQINKFMKLANPQIITGLILQANILLSGAIASFAQGGISTLYFAERLYQLPLALFGISIGTVLLPTLSSLHIKNDIAEINLVVRRSVKFALIMSIPAATGLMIISVPIITLIYQHGLFNELNTILVSKTLIAFSIGLPAFILIKIYLPIFYSMGDTKNPLRYSLISTAINIIRITTTDPKTLFPAKMEAIAKHS